MAIFLQVNKAEVIELALTNKNITKLIYLARILLLSLLPKGVILNTFAGFFFWGGGGKGEDTDSFDNLR